MQGGGAGGGGHLGRLEWIHHRRLLVYQRIVTPIGRNDVAYNDIAPAVSG